MVIHTQADELFSVFDHFVEPATLLKVTLFHRCFSRFLNCSNDIKSRKASHIFFRNQQVDSFKFLHDAGRYHIEARPLICWANKWNGFYVIETSVTKELSYYLITSRYIFRIFTKNRSNCRKIHVPNLRI